MSKFVRVQTALREVALIKQSLEDLQIAYEENARYAHVWSGYQGQVPLLITHQRIKFGLRLGSDESYEVIGDDMHMATIRKTMEQVQQRYAYHKVVAETSKAGFDLVEESTGRDQVIRLTVRRWS